MHNLPKVMQLADGRSGHSKIPYPSNKVGINGGKLRITAESVPLTQWNDVTDFKNPDPEKGSDSLCR